MLLPYYIASMNIEHAYLEKVGEYEPFEGICLVDTFENSGQAGLFSTENTKRIRRQLDAPIRVVIANPPYNMGQQNENDQNKNRRYASNGGVDERVAGTYTKDSQATLRNKLSDPYVKAFRWATDRIKDHGVVCFVSNSSFIDQIAFDGMRKHLMQDFSRIYVIDLGGNVRKNPRLSGTTHNVFGIQVGVAITILIRHEKNDTQKPANVFYVSVGEEWKKEQKYAQLNTWSALPKVDWKQLAPDARNTWLTEGQQEDFEALMPIGSKESKGEDTTRSVFRLYSLGIVTSRDNWVINGSPTTILENLGRTESTFRAEQLRFS
jgi:predicted helicase